MRPEPTWRVAREAWPLAGGPALLAVVAWVLGLAWLAVASIAVALAILAFFRDPNRRWQGDASLVVAPADGRVVESRSSSASPVLVSIFLSIFDVHINRVPASGEVLRVERTPGVFRAAFHPSASSENERVAVTIRTTHGDVECVQVAGLVARRIVCRLEPGDRVEAGQRYGLIRFGSRVDVRLPPGTKVLVARGDRTRGGVTPLAHLANTIRT